MPANKGLLALLSVVVGTVLGAVVFWPKDAKAELQAPGSGSATPHELALSHRTGLTVAVLRAIAKVESGGGSREHTPGQGVGSGHTSKPKVIRFEPHVFLYITRASGSAGTKVEQRRTSPYFDQIPYTASRDDARWAPAGRPGRESVSYVPAETQWAALMHAFSLDRSAAIRATSWGRFQVMGGWFKNTLASDPVAFIQRWVNADLNSIEDLSDEMLVEWIIGNPLALKAAKERDWLQFSLLYNNSAQYETKFVAAYAEAVAAGAPTTMIA